MKLSQNPNISTLRFWCCDCWGRYLSSVSRLAHLCTCCSWLLNCSCEQLWKHFDQIRANNVQRKLCCINLAYHRNTHLTPSHMHLHYYDIKKTTTFILTLIWFHDLWWWELSKTLWLLQKWNLTWFLFLAVYWSKCPNSRFDCGGACLLFQCVKIHTVALKVEFRYIPLFFIPITKVNWGVILTVCRVKQRLILFLFMYLNIYFSIYVFVIFGPS